MNYCKPDCFKYRGWDSIPLHIGYRERKYTAEYRYEGKRERKESYKYGYKYIRKYKKHYSKITLFEYGHILK